MNVKQAALKWKLSENTIRDYCKENTISECEKINGVWCINEEALQPYIFKENVEESRLKIYPIILKALDKNRTITCVSLGITNDDLLDYFDNLEISNLIRKKRKHNNKDIFKNYTVTPTTEDYLKRNKKFNSEIIGYIINVLGVTATIASQFMG